MKFHLHAIAAAAIVRAALAGTAGDQVVISGSTLTLPD
jgi:hypothetical protein